MGLTYSLFLDLTLTTLTSPSSPGYTSITRPRGYLPRLASGSIIITTSPFFKLCLGWNHFFHTLIRGKNSFLHRFQNIFSSCCTRCHFFFGLYASVSSSASGANGPPNCPVRKWLRVRGDKSLWSELTYVSGLELISRSAPHIAVWSSSSFTSASPSMDLMAFSHSLSTLQRHRQNEEQSVD